MAFMKHVFPKFRSPVAQMAVVLPYETGQEEAISNAKTRPLLQTPKQRPIFDTLASSHYLELVLFCPINISNSLSTLCVSVWIFLEGRF